MFVDTKHQPSSTNSRLLVVAAGNEARVVLEMFGLVIDPPSGNARGPALARYFAAASTHLAAEALTPWSLVQLNRADLLISGVGKANATGAVMAAAAASRYASIINLGIGGALPREPEPVAIGQIVLGTHAHFADEGVQTPNGFLPLASLGFATGLDGTDSVRPDPALAGQLAPLADIAGGIATVSVCSGTDQLAREIAQRTGAIAEGMEGAGVLLAASRLGIPGAELRVISNTTGDRTRQVWDMKSAMNRLAQLAALLA